MDPQPPDDQLTPRVNSNDHVLGNQHASTTLLEYGDYQCPYCGQGLLRTA